MEVLVPVEVTAVDPVVVADVAVDVVAVVAVARKMPKNGSR